MNKNDFMNRINEDLSSLTDEERADALKYYEEYFAEAADDGDSESVDELARRIENEFAALTLSAPEYAAPEAEITVAAKPKRENPKREHNYGNREMKLGLLIVLLCTFPVWLPIIIALVSVAFGVFMTVFGVAFAVAAMALAGFIMVGAGFMSIGYGVFNLFTDAANALYPLGAGFVAIGIGIITAVIFTKLASVIFKSQFKLAGLTINGITNKLSRRGA